MNLHHCLGTFNTDHFLYFCGNSFIVENHQKSYAAKIGKIDQIFESFPVSGQFDAVVRIEVDDLSTIKDIATKIQKMIGVERTETMVEVHSN